MKTLYLECGMGAAGDMLTAALYELLEDDQKKWFLEKMNAVMPGVTVEAEKAVKCGITGTHMRVLVHGEEEESMDDHEHHHHDHDECHEHHHGHHHTSMTDVEMILRHLPVSDAVKEHAKSVYQLIARAESEVHGMQIDQIHFHEVGSLDAVMDVVAVCLLIDCIAPDKIIASPVHVGSGYVRCAHGVLPVPAPATARILMGVPTYGGSVEGELCTPTGAALLKHFAAGFGDRPLMAVEKIGYGMGRKDFPRANCVRAFLGETGTDREEVVKLECNVDDMTGEEIAFAMESLFMEGARDVFTTPIGMKKSRPATMITCICMPDQTEKLATVMMKHTTTLGIRVIPCNRYVLDRETKLCETPYGNVTVKVSTGMGVTREKVEYEDLARLAREQKTDLRSVREAIGK